MPVKGMRVQLLPVSGVRGIDVNTVKNILTELCILLRVSLLPTAKEAYQENNISLDTHGK